MFIFGPAIMSFCKRYIQAHLAIFGKQFHNSTMNALRNFGIAFLSKSLYVAESSFDLPTSGLWAQHASSAPFC